MHKLHLFCFILRATLILTLTFLDLLTGFDKTRYATYLWHEHYINVPDFNSP